MSATFPATWPAAAHALVSDRPELGTTWAAGVVEAVCAA